MRDDPDQEVSAGMFYTKKGSNVTSEVHDGSPAKKQLSKKNTRRSGSSKKEAQQAKDLKKNLEYQKSQIQKTILNTTSKKDITNTIDQNEELFENSNGVDLTKRSNLEVLAD